MNDNIEEMFDGIDAAFFTGDSLRSEDALNRAEWYMARWLREIVNIRAALGEKNTEDC